MCTGDPSSVLKTPTWEDIYNRGPLGQTQQDNGVYYYGTRGAIGVATLAASAASAASVAGVAELAGGPSSQRSSVRGDRSTSCIRSEILNGSTQPGEAWDD